MAGGENDPEAPGTDSPQGDPAPDTSEPYTEGGESTEEGDGTSSGEGEESEAPSPEVESA